MAQFLLDDLFASKKGFPGEEEDFESNNLQPGIGREFVGFKNGITENNLIQLFN